MVRKPNLVLSLGFFLCMSSALRVPIFSYATINSIIIELSSYSFEGCIYRQVHLVQDIALLLCSYLQTLLFLEHRN